MEMHDEFFPDEIFYKQRGVSNPYAQLHARNETEESSMLATLDFMFGDGAGKRMVTHAQTYLHIDLNADSFAEAEKYWMKTLRVPIIGEATWWKQGDPIEDLMKHEYIEFAWRAGGQT